MYYPDLHHKCQIADGKAVRAVGWLSSEFPFSTGGVTPPEFLPALRLLIRRGWVPMAAAGAHECEFCASDAYRASANVLVPSEQLLYVAPAMIVHYVEQHAYAPPDEFVRAVLDCPAPGTEAYEARLKRFLGGWTDFVALEVLEHFVRQHREKCAEPEPEHLMLDGPGAFDPPWYVSLSGGVEASPLPIAKVFADRWKVPVTEALSRLRANDTVLEFESAPEAERWVARLHAAGATTTVTNGKRRPW